MEEGRKGEKEERVRGEGRDDDENRGDREGGERKRKERGKKKEGKRKEREENTCWKEPSKAELDLSIKAFKLDKSVVLGERRDLSEMREMKEKKRSREEMAQLDLLEFQILRSSVKQVIETRTWMIALI